MLFRSVQDHLGFKAEMILHGGNMLIPYKHTIFPHKHVTMAGLCAAESALLRFGGALNNSNEVEHEHETEGRIVCRRPRRSRGSPGDREVPHAAGEHTNVGKQHLRVVLEGTTVLSKP